MPAQHVERLGVHMESGEPSIPTQSHVPRRDVATYLEGSKRAPDSKLESSSSATCSDAEEPDALVAIMRNEDPQPAPHV